MNINDIRKLLREGRSVVLVEEGQTPLLVTELTVDQPVVEEVQISSRWPKARTVHDPAPKPQEEVLERLNKEILALKAQIAEDEGAN